MNLVPKVVRYLLELGDELKMECCGASVVGHFFVTIKHVGAERVF
jgi:hypothetical protein